MLKDSYEVAGKVLVLSENKGKIKYFCLCFFFFISPSLPSSQMTEAELNLRLSVFCSPCCVIYSRNTHHHSAEKEIAV